MTSSRSFLHHHATSPSVLLISGPTASGKSGLAVSLAKRLDGEVINIDSVQVYRGARIGAATIAEEEMAGIPHHGIGFLDPAEPWDVRRMADWVGQTAREIRARGRLPILVGGGGMYVSALFSGIARLPEKNETLRDELEALDSERLYLQLTESDPARAAQLHPHDRLRVIRALETIRERGASTAELYGEAFPPWVTGLMVVLCPPREPLYQAINIRVVEMVSHGLCDEVALLEESVPGDAVLWRAIGYSHARSFRAGLTSFEQFQSDMQRDTRRFAKRQMTYWRNEPRKRGWDELLPPTDWTWLGDRGRIEALCGQHPVAVIRVPLMGSEMRSLFSNNDEALKPLLPSW